MAMTGTTSRSRRDVIFSVALLAACLLFSRMGHGQDYEALSHGVVKIVSKSDEGQVRTGSGIIVRLDRQVAYIVTAAHVVAGDKHPNIFFAAQRHVSVSGTVLRSDEGIDVSLLEVRGADKLPAGVLSLGLATDDKINKGEVVATIGCPAGLGDWAVSRPTIGARQGINLTLAGAIAEGNSGGPVLSGDKVVAMVVKVQGIAGIAVPASILYAALEGWSVVAEKSPAPSNAPVASVPEVNCPAAPKPAQLTASMARNGVVFESRCFYLGNGRESCTQTCQRLKQGGRCDAAGLRAIADTLDRCQAVVAALGGPSGLDYANFGAYPDDDSGCTYGDWGAPEKRWVQLMRRTEQGPTCDAANADPMRMRVCACQ